MGRFENIDAFDSSVGLRRFAHTWFVGNVCGRKEREECIARLGCIGRHRVAELKDVVSGGMLYDEHTGEELRVEVDDGWERRVYPNKGS